MGAPENAVEGYLQKVCDKRGIFCRKFVSPGTNGYPDRILVHDGTVVFVEAKRPGGRLRKLQAVRIGELRDHGANAEVADTREAVDALVESYWPSDTAPSA